MFAGPIDTSIPDPTVNFGPYELIINPNSSGSSTVTVTYSTSSSAAPSIQQVIPTNGSPATLPVVYNYFLVTYNDESPAVTYKVYPKYQLKLPVTTRYNATDAALISQIAFNSVSGSGSVFTITVTPSP